MIKVKNLSFSYPKSKETVLKNLNFEIEQGEIFGFLGPSGAGKSTTQKVLYKILHNFTGEISIKNKSLKDWGNEYFEKIGVGFELPNHYLKLTAKENLKLFASFYPKESMLDFDALFEIFPRDGEVARAGSRDQGLAWTFSFRSNRRFVRKSRAVLIMISKRFQHRLVL